jgi:hypothetical protein
MKRQGMILSQLDEKMLGRFRYMFYRRTGIERDPRIIIYGLKSIVTHGTRGWAFEQQLEGGFTMVFRHYGVRADKTDYGKYDHIIYLDIEPQKPRITDEAGQKAYEVKKNVALEVTREIEADLVARGLAIEIDLTSLA